MPSAISSLRDKFLDSFKRADALEVDGFFCRHFDNTLVNDTSGAADACVIEVSFAGPEGDVDLFLCESDLDDVSFDEQAKVWSVGEHDVSFFTVTPLAE